MQNYIQPGKTIALTAPYTVTSGQGALVGSIFGVACGDYASGDTEAQFTTEGVFELPKDASVFSQGEKVYWNSVERTVGENDSGLSYLIGVAVEAAPTGAANVKVRLNGISVS